MALVMSINSWTQSNSFLIYLNKTLVSSDSDQDEVFSDDNVAVVISSTDSLRGVQAEMSVAEAIAPEKVSYTMSPVLQDKTHRKSAKGSLLSSSNLQPGGSNQRF